MSGEFAESVPPSIEGAVLKLHGIVTPPNFRVYYQDQALVGNIRLSLEGRDLWGQNTTFPFLTFTYQPVSAERIKNLFDIFSDDRILKNHPGLTTYKNEKVIIYGPNDQPAFRVASTGKEITLEASAAMLTSNDLQVFMEALDLSEEESRKICMSLSTLASVVTSKINKEYLDHKDAEKFAVRVTDSLLSSATIKALSQRLCLPPDKRDSPTAVSVLRAAELGLQNFREKQFPYDLYRKLKALEKAGINKIGIHDISIDVQALLSLDFWEKDFPEMIQRMVLNGGLLLRHGLGSEYHKIGFPMGFDPSTDFSGYSEDVIGPYIQANGLESVKCSTMIVPASQYEIVRNTRYDHVYGSGNAYFTIPSLSDRTVVFDFDTGHPDSMMDLITDGPNEERQKSVYNTVWGAVVFLVRDWLPQLCDSSLGKIKPCQEDPSFRFMEGNTLGAIDLAQSAEYFEISDQSTEIQSVQKIGNEIGVKVVNVSLDN